MSLGIRHKWSITDKRIVFKLANSDINFKLGEYVNLTHQCGSKWSKCHDKDG